MIGRAFYVVGYLAWLVMVLGFEGGEIEFHEA